MGKWALKHGTDFASNFETILLNFHPTADIIYSRNRRPCYKLPIVVPPIILGIAALVIFFLFCYLHLIDIFIYFPLDCWLRIPGVS